MKNGVLTEREMDEQQMHIALELDRIRREKEGDYPLTEPELRAAYDSSEWLRYAIESDHPAIVAWAKNFMAHPTKLHRETAMLETIKHLAEENKRLRDDALLRVRMQPSFFVLNKEP